MQPNMVKQSREFVGAQGHHLLSQGDGIYEGEVHVFPVWGDALGFSKNHLRIEGGIVCHEHHPIYTCGELGVDLWEGGRVGDISVGDAVDVGVFNLLAGPGPRKVDTSGVSYAAWVSVAELSASKSSGARRLHQECRLRVL